MSRGIFTSETVRFSRRRHLLQFFIKRLGNPLQAVFGKVNSGFGEKGIAYGKPDVEPFSRFPHVQNPFRGPRPPRYLDPLHLAPAFLRKTDRETFLLCYKGTVLN